MTRFTHKPSLISIWAASFGFWAVALPAAGQELPGDQLFTFGIREKVAATDNIRLDNTSVGTTYYSDTVFSFGFDNESGPHALSFSAEGVGRIVNDPLIGTDSDFRDPKADLSYTLDGINSRLSLLASYSKPDLAFLDPLLEGDINDQDFFRGGGQREEYYAGIHFETGLQGPIGFVFDLNSQARRYVNTTDPLLVSNQTDTAAVGLSFRFSPVARGRLDVSDSLYRADDAADTERETRNLTFGLDYELSAISTISIDFGHSKVLETFGAFPGTENNLSGPVGSVFFQRQMPDGDVSASLDTFITQSGRQNNIEAGRTFELTNGAFEFSIGVAEGETFNPRPIGSIAYSTETSRGAFNASLSRTAQISDTLSRATETTQVDLGYAVDLNDVSGLAFNLNYADISLVGNNASNQGRERGSFYATYSHDITEDWDLVLGYEYKYFNPDSGGSAKSNGIFFSLQRDFKVFR